MRRTLFSMTGLIMIFGLIGCGGSKPGDLGVHGDRLAPCPSRPNCVASDADDADQRVAPLQIGDNREAAWQALTDIVAALPRTRITTSEAEYLHAESKSRFLGFIDDVEFHLRPKTGEIAVRSAARVGYSDFGVNAARIEAIRAALEERGFGSK